MKNVLYFLFAVLFFQSCYQPRRSEYVLDEVELVPEGIAYSEAQQKFYLNSIGKRKIVVLDPKTGEQEDFIASGEYNFAPGVGILADDERNKLHALAGYFRFNDSVSSLYTFDLSSKKLVRKLGLTGKGHFLNDLVIDSYGNLYATDTKSSSVYFLKQDGEAWEEFFKSEEIRFPNGIAISDDGSKLFIASGQKGVRILDVKTRTILNEADTTNMSKGIDGLEFYRGNLYAVQNWVKENGDNFRKLTLNDRQDKITGYKVIDQDSSRLDLPLTFCIAEGRAVLIANSNLQYLDQEKFNFPQADSLKATRLLIYDLEDL